MVIVVCFSWRSYILIWMAGLHIFWIRHGVRVLNMILIAFLNRIWTWMRHSICTWLNRHSVRICHLSFMGYSIRIFIYTLDLVWLMHFMIISIFRIDMIRCQMNFVVMLWWISGLLLNFIIFVIIFHSILALILYI